MMATVPHVTSGLGLRKFQADGFLLTRVYLFTGQYIFFAANFTPNRFSFVICGYKRSYIDIAAT